MAFQGIFQGFFKAISTTLKATFFRTVQGLSCNRTNVFDFVSLLGFGWMDNVLVFAKFLAFHFLGRRTFCRFECFDAF